MRLLADRSSLAFTILFFLGLEVLTVVTRFYWPFFTTLLTLLLVGTFIMLRHDVRARGPHVLILPLSYIGSVLLFHLFISQGMFQHLFIFLATLGVFFLVARGVEWAYPTWNWFFTSATFFLFTAGIDGLAFHLRFPLWAVVLPVGTMTFLLSFHVLGRAAISHRQRLFWSVILALLMGEVLTAFSFLPLSYLVVSGSLFVAFYIALHLLQRYMYETLTVKLIREYLLLGSVATAFMLSTARWAVF